MDKMNSKSHQQQMMRSYSSSFATTKRKTNSFGNSNYSISWSLAAAILAVLAFIPKTSMAFQLCTISPIANILFRHDRCSRMHTSSDAYITMTKHHYHQHGIRTSSSFSSNVSRRGRYRRSGISTFLLSSTNASVGKSGGRVIDSLLSFETQVLLKTSSKENKNKNPNPSDVDNSNIDNNNIVMVFYTAPWCGPCRLSNPVVKEINQLFKSTGQLDVVEICTDDLPEVPEMAGVVSIPTIQLYHKGQLQETIVGCVAKNVLEKAIRKLMEEISPPSVDEKKES